LKKTIYLLLLSIVFISCKTKSNIITSKEVAVEKGIYEYDTKKNLAIAKKSELKAKKELEKKAIELAKQLKKKEALSKKLEKNNNSGINPVRLSIVEKAKEFIGTPYRYGGTTTNGLDCSGLTCNSYKKAEIELPRRSIDQSNEGIKIKKSKAKPGDLIFFKTSRRNVINHVGIITENNNGDISFIHASSSSGVVISSLLESYYKNAFAKIKRIIE
jgi:murein DD-endopeptidase / murein LD-carboxypeptidase